jgi:hypothetical protein
VQIANCIGLRNPRRQSRLQSPSTVGPSARERFSSSTFYPVERTAAPSGQGCNAAIQPKNAQHSFNPRAFQLFNPRLQSSHSTQNRRSQAVPSSPHLSHTVPSPTLHVSRTGRKTYKHSVLAHPTLSRSHQSQQLTPDHFPTGLRPQRAAPKHSLKGRNNTAQGSALGVIQYSISTLFVDGVKLIINP